MSDLTWVDRTMVIDAIDTARTAIEDNPGWRLLHVGMGSGGQTTLTYGWPWPGTPEDVTLKLRPAPHAPDLDEPPF